MASEESVKRVSPTWTVYKINHNEAINKIEEEAMGLIVDELEKLIKYSPKRYTAILWAISLGLRK